MFKISFSTSLKFISLDLKCAAKLKFSVRATILGWFSYFLKAVYTGSEYLKAFIILLHSVIFHLSTISSKKLLIVFDTFWSPEVMASFSLRVTLVETGALLKWRGLIVFQCFVICYSVYIDFKIKLPFFLLT